MNNKAKKETKNRKFDNEPKWEKKDKDGKQQLTTKMMIMENTINFYVSGKFLFFVVVIICLVCWWNFVFPPLLIVAFKREKDVDRSKQKKQAFPRKTYCKSLY